MSATFCSSIVFAITLFSCVPIYESLTGEDGETTKSCPESTRFHIRWPVFAGLDQAVFTSIETEQTLTNCSTRVPMLSFSAPEAVTAEPTEGGVQLRGSIPGVHRIGVAAPGETFTAKTAFDFVVIRDFQVTGQFTYPKSVTVLTNYSNRDIASDPFKGCGRELVAELNYFACTGSYTWVFSNDLAELINEEGLYPRLWGIAGDGNLLARASFIDSALRVDEYSSDGSLIRTASYFPPQNPHLNRIQADPLCKTGCDSPPSNLPNNVAVSDDLVAMSDLYGGLYLLRYEEGQLRQLSVTYLHEELEISGTQTSIPHPVFIDGSRAYLFSGEKPLGRFMTLDITDPARPIILYKTKLPDAVASANMDSGLFWWVLNHHVQAARLVEGDFRVTLDFEVRGAQLLVVRGSRGIVVSEDNSVVDFIVEGDQIRISRTARHPFDGLEDPAINPEALSEFSTDLEEYRFLRSYLYPNLALSEDGSIIVTSSSSPIVVKLE